MVNNGEAAAINGAMNGQQQGNQGDAADGEYDTNLYSRQL